MTEDFEVRDGSRSFKFSGVRLATATSRADGKARWFDLSIYRTQGGSYVVHGAGRTLVNGERDREWVSISEAPEGVIESLYLRDGDGVRYLTNVARGALRDAASRDEGIRQAYAVEHID